MGTTHLLTGLLLVGLGFLVKAMPNLIAGYNTLPEERKRNVDIEGLSSLMRNGLVIIGLVIVTGHYLLHWIGLSGIADLMIPLSILPGTIVILVLAQRYVHR